MNDRQQQKSALEEMVDAMLSAVESDPEWVIDRAWCQGVVELLFAMDPALAFPLLRRVRSVLREHALRHRCSAPTVFQECYEAHRAAIAIK